MKTNQDPWKKHGEEAAKEPPILVNETEAARLLGISARSMWSLAKRGDISPVWIGGRKLYRRADLNGFVTTVGVPSPSLSQPTTESTHP